MKKMILMGFITALMAQGAIAVAYAAKETCTGCKQYGDVWYCDNCQVD